MSGDMVFPFIDQSLAWGDYVTGWGPTGATAAEGRQSWLVESLLVERNRGWFGVDLMRVSEAMAQALNVPRSGGFLVKQVVKNSVGGRLGLHAFRHGDLEPVRRVLFSRPAGTALSATRAEPA